MYNSKMAVDMLKKFGLILRVTIPQRHFGVRRISAILTIVQLVIAWQRQHS